MYGRHRGGAAANHKGVDTWRAHPHAKQLGVFGGLIMDGFTFSSTGSRGRAKSARSFKLVAIAGRPASGKGERVGEKSRDEEKHEF